MVPQIRILPTSLGGGIKTKGLELIHMHRFDTERRMPGPKTMSDYVCRLSYDILCRALGGDDCLLLLPHPSLTLYHLTVKWQALDAISLPDFNFPQSSFFSLCD